MAKKCDLDYTGKQHVYTFIYIPIFFPNWKQILHNLVLITKQIFRLDQSN